jgi:hypothetical protein
MNRGTGFPFVQLLASSLPYEAYSTYPSSLCVLLLSLLPLFFVLLLLFLLCLPILLGL